jgi:predicted phosphate transport protein (TIGR00153 family)
MALTRDSVFWDAFSAMTEKTVAAADHLLKMLEQPDQAAQLASKIKDLEHEGDHITHEVVMALHQTWITPLDRDEIHSLITRLDDVLDYIDSAGDKLALYEITETRSEAVELAKVLSESTRDMQSAIRQLTKIKDPKPILDLCRAINRHEHDADAMFRRGIARLFKERPDPLEVMKWRDIMDALEAATDRAEDVANVIEGIVLEHA